MRAVRLLARSGAVVLGTVGLTVAGGAASAFWTGGGAGTGTVTTAGVQPVSVTVTPAAQLFPGQPPQPVELRLSNPNPFRVVVTRVAPGPVAVSGAAGCTASGSAVSFSTLDGPWTVGPSATVSVTVAGGVRMGATAASDCQGAGFTASLTLTATTG